MTGKGADLGRKDMEAEIKIVSGEVKAEKRARKKNEIGGVKTEEAAAETGRRGVKAGRKIVKGQEGKGLSPLFSYLEERNLMLNIKNHLQ